MWCELVLHALVFMLLAVGLWVNSAQVRAEYWKQTLNAQLTEPFSPQRVQFGRNLSNSVQLWEWMNGGPLTRLLLFPDANRSLLESTCLPRIQASTPTTAPATLECEFSAPAQSPWLARPGLALVVDSGVVFRQYRVAINTCGSPRFFPCFGAFSAETMETRRFGPALLNSPNSDCGFTWTNPRQTQALIATRSGAQLEQSGYVFTVLDYRQLLPGLEYLQANNWTGAATRAMTVQFVLQTASAGGSELLAVQLLVEINEIGNVFTSAHYYSNARISPTRLATDVLALLVELVILLVAAVWLKANLALDGVLHAWAWLAKLWDVILVLLFAASFGLDAALFASPPPEGFAQVQSTDALMLTANRFRYVFIAMQTVRLCGLCTQLAFPSPWRKLVWQVPLLYCALTLLGLPLYCTLSVFDMVLRGSRVDFYVAMRNVFTSVVTGEGEDDAFVLLLLTLAWVFAVPSLLAMTVQLVVRNSAAR